jgi:hypothetical protein
MPVRTSKVLKSFGDWVVTTYGIECTTNYYPIEKNRIWEIDWVRQIREKIWGMHIVDEFILALDYARELWPKKNKRRKIR